MTEPRRIWLVFHGGVFVEARWALVRTPAEVPAKLPAPLTRANVCHALSAAQAADPTWDAIPCEWRDVPALVGEALLAGKRATAAGQFDGPGVARFDGRALRFAGVKFHTADRGRPVEGKGEPLPPDAEIVDLAELQAHAEKAGRDVELVERGTLRAVKAQPTKGLAKE